LDILCVAETHLRGSEQLVIPGYTYFGQNRAKLSSKAKCGSGGVGVLIKNAMLSKYDAEILNDSVEGILWIQLRAKYDHSVYNVCVCYLPPEGSSRKMDVCDFYDELLSHVYLYQNDGPFYICGDFNSRVGKLVDFTEGVDDISERDVIDFTVNTYGELLIDFLVNTNCCMLNGRQNACNDFTSVSNKGKAVVDYCLVSHECLSEFKDFEVVQAKQVFEDAGCLGMLDPTRSAIPDHSVLKWNIVLKPKVLHLKRLTGHTRLLNITEMSLMILCLIM
jgi:exonuclease III